MITFFFYITIVFFSFRKLFDSYFEADEWFHFTNYIPYTRQAFGFLMPLFNFFASAQSLSEWQHLIPISTEIFFLNTLLFGTNFTQYAFMSLLLHAVNSFILFLFIEELLKKHISKTIIALIGGLFFALNATHIHALTWAAFYGQNVLSVTFFLLSLFFLKKAFNSGRIHFLYISAVFLFIDLLTKETAAILFIFIPVMIVMEKRIFSFKTLIKAYILPVCMYIPFRFMLPVLYQWANNYATSATTPQVSFDYSIFFFRLFTFPLNMLAEVFLPRRTVQDIVSFITPIIYPQFDQEGEVRVINRLHFIYGPGNDLLIYMFGIGILILSLVILRRYWLKRQIDEFKSYILALVIIVTSALPLVINVIALKYWGIDFFDSRHYYMPTVGAAIIFSLILYRSSIWLSKRITATFKIKLQFRLIIYILFFAWLLQNSNPFNMLFKGIIETAGPRKLIVKAIKNAVPALNQKAIFYTETDIELGKTGLPQPVLPFQTSFAQILTVIYFDREKNPLPDEFYKEFFLKELGEGYKEVNGRGLGYFRSKKGLADELLRNHFNVQDVSAFYYDAAENKVTNITAKTRRELYDFLFEREQYKTWKEYELKDLGLQLKIPPDYFVKEVNKKDYDLTGKNDVNGKSITIENPFHRYAVNIVQAEPTSDTKSIYKKIDESMKMLSSTETVEVKKIFFDKFHFQEAIIITSKDKNTYLFKVDNLLISIIDDSAFEDTAAILEKIIGSIDKID